MTETPPAAENLPPSLEMHEYTKEAACDTPEGYFWLRLPESPQLFASFLGGAPARALACEKCGALVSATVTHDEYHAGDRR